MCCDLHFRDATLQQLAKAHLSVNYANMPILRVHLFLHPSLHKTQFPTTYNVLCSLIEMFKAVLWGLGSFPLPWFQEQDSLIIPRHSYPQLT